MTALIAVGMGAAYLLLDKHLPLLMASRRAPGSAGLLERIFSRSPRSNP